MNGIHDLGGMHGFGAIEREENEPVFHTDWERRAFALDLLVEGVVDGTNIDAFRHAIECLDPTTYLTASYYARWVRAIETLLVENGVLDRDEIERRIAELGGEVE